MAAVATGVGLRMAHLTTDRILMGLMSFNVFPFFGIYLLVAVFTFRAIFNIVAMFIVFVVSVHFRCRMTLFASHSFFLKMNVRFTLFFFAQKFLADSAAVAGNANLLHGWPFLEQMPGKKAAADAGRPADVALTATGVALGTMSLLGGCDLISYF